MLVGIFDSFPKIPGSINYINPIDMQRKAYQPLDAPPVFAFPIISIEDFFAQSLCNLDYKIEMLYILDVEEGIRIDRIRWYKDILSGKEIENILDYEDDTVDDEHSLILLTPETAFGEGVKMKLVVNLMAIKDFIEGKVNIQTVFLEEANVPEEIESFIKEKMVDVWKKLPELSIPNYDKLDFQQKAQAPEIAKCRATFNAVLLPFVYCWAIGEPAYGFLREACSANVLTMCKVWNEFAEWANNNGSIEEYNEIYEKAKDLPIMEVNTLVALATNEKLEPNEKCPCGSGKKWKKCHGRMVVG